MAVATKRDFSISYGLQTDRTGTSTGNTLFVDQVNDRVGVGQGVPSYTLDVSGDINFTGTLYKNGAEHVASRWTLTGSNIYRLSNVGIQVNDPNYDLDVNSQVRTRSGSAISYALANTYLIWSNDVEVSALEAPSSWKTMKTFTSSKTGNVRVKFSAYINSGDYYWAWRITSQIGTVVASGYYNGGLDTGESESVHAYRRFVADLSTTNPGDVYTLQMVSADSSGQAVLGVTASSPVGGQTLYCKEFRIYSATPSVENGGASNIWGSSVGVGTQFPTSRFHVESNWISSTTNDIATFARTGNLVNLKIGYDETNTDMYIGTGTDHALQLRTNNTTRITVLQTGNVGVNETNPGSQLAVNGYITESTDSGTTYWNVVTQQDIGTDANQVPLNQYLGQLAFLDDISPVKISDVAPSSNLVQGKLWWDSTGGRLYVYYNDGTTSNWVDASPFGTTTDLVVDGTLTVRTKAMIGNDSTATNLEIKVTATQADNTNKALTINNNDQTSGLDISYRGEILPKADADVNLGGPSNRWANIYSADLQLSNEGSHNDVDGTWGKYTIQEGEEDLFLINRRSGKKYKFVLQEV